MTVKTLTITENAYNKLLRLKRAHESFSKLFMRLAEKEKPDIMKYAGLLTDEEAEKVKLHMGKFRKEFNASYMERAKRVEKLWKS